MKAAASCQETTIFLLEQQFAEWFNTVNSKNCRSGRGIGNLLTTLSTLGKQQLPELFGRSYNCSNWYHGALNVWCERGPGVLPCDGGRVPSTTSRLNLPTLLISHIASD